MADKLILHEIERRVLGVLMEKSMAQPDYYPMTLNALVAACNQKQNRDPVMDLDEDTVWQTLESLRKLNLVTMVFPAPGARTKRFKHEVDKVVGWQPRERAVMTELLLRGPQTVGELRTRCMRFMPFEGLEAVALVLDCLAKYDPPVVTAMAREPGRSAIRYRHMLYPEDEAPAAATSPMPAAAAPVQSRPAPTAMQPQPAQAPAAQPAPGPVVDAGLQAEVENLQVEVAELQEAVANLTRRLESIETQLL